MKNIILIVIAVAIIVGFLAIANKQSSLIMTVGDCVDQRIKADGFKGSIEEGWNIYAEDCVKNK